MSTTLSTERKGLILVLLAAAQFVVVLDASIVNVALPSIGRDLTLDQDSLSWVVNSYVLIFGGFLLLGGRIADLLGRKRIFIVGLLLFCLASLLGGLSQNETQLISARVVQGLGAALLSPAALAILTTTFKEGAERNKALGVWGAVAGSGGAVGVLLGGILTQSLGWEWVLFVNVPITALAAVGAFRVLGESRDESASSFDIFGAITITGGLSLLVYTIVDANSSGWGSSKTISLFIVSFVLIAAFIAIERVWKQPLLPFRIFRNRTLTGANLTGVFVAMSLFSMFFFVSLYMQQVLGYSALKAGLAYLPLAGGIIVSAGLASVLTTRIGFKPVLAGGMTLVAAGLFWFSRVSPDGSFTGDILFPSLLAALGLGFAFVPLTIASVAGVEPDDAGLASGLINTSQQVGGALGLAILVAVSNSRFGNVTGTPPERLTESFQSAFLVGAYLAVTGAVLSLVLISSRHSKEHRDAAQAGELQPVAV
jgi:EmrB/QacA subfamily drug resistance transporter